MQFTLIFIHSAFVLIIKFGISLNATAEWLRVGKEPP